MPWILLLLHWNWAQIIDFWSKLGVMIMKYFFFHLFMFTSGIVWVLYWLKGLILIRYWKLSVTWCIHWIPVRCSGSVLVVISFTLQQQKLSKVWFSVVVKLILLWNLLSTVTLNLGVIYGPTSEIICFSTTEFLSLIKNQNILSSTVSIKITDGKCLFGGVIPLVDRTRCIISQLFLYVLFFFPLCRSTDCFCAFDRLPSLTDGDRCP